MVKNWYLLTAVQLQILLCLVGLGMLIIGASSVQAEVLAQQPTVDVPTVTGTPSGPIASVNIDQTVVYVHTGPGQDYPVIGILVGGQKVPALGISRGGDWVQIVYPGGPDGVGWVFGRLMTLTGELPVFTPPPTPTPRSSPTFDPTLEAQFIGGVAATPLPTFTEPPLLANPTPGGITTTIVSRSVPMGFIIIGLAVVGLFGVTISFLRGR